MIFSVSTLLKVSHHRKPGYIEAVITIAKNLDDDNYELTDEQMSSISRDYRLSSKSVGLGDAVAAIATPIARILGLPCVDPATKQLRPDSPCAKRKARLNAAVPNVNPLAPKS